MGTNLLSSLLRLSRYTAIVVALTGLLLLGMELTVRTLAPQTIQVTYRGGQSLGQRDDALGHVNRAGAEVSVTGPEFAAEYVTNSRGFRDESPHVMPKPSGLTRILILGDSFAFGAGNDYERIWPVIFERQLAARGYRVDVVKAGVSAFDTTREARYLTQLFPEYSPDFVLLTFLPNDLFDNRSLTDDLTIEQGHDESVRSQDDEPFTLHSVLLGRRWLAGSDRLYVGLYNLTARAEYFGDSLSPRLAHQLSITQELLANMQAFCAHRGATFAVLSIPQQVQVLAAANGFQIRDFDVNLVDREFSRFAHDNVFDWIPAMPSLVQQYRSARRDLYYRLDGHLNNEGNRVTGEFLTNEFETRFGRQLARLAPQP